MREDLSFQKFCKTAEMITTLDSYRKKEIRLYICITDYIIKEAFKMLK